MLKRKTKLAKILLMALAFTLVFSSLAIAQPLKGDELSISIWPEYDEPGVLIIYSGEIRNTSAEPFEGRVVLNIPKGVAKAEMVCETEQGMLCLPYQITQMEDYAELSWAVSKPIQPGAVLPFMAEFYYDPIEGEVDKSLTYDFIASFDIDRLIFDVKEPFDASNFTIEPVFDYVGDDNNGFSTYKYTVFNLAQEENEQVTVSYTRESNEPSIDRALVTGGGNQQNLAGGENTVNSTTIILLASFLGLMGFFMVYALKLNNGKKSNSKANAKSKKKQSAGKVTQSAAEQKKKLRKMLLDGKITEETYKELLEELEKDK